MDFVGILKAVVIGLIEGITEWLPVSSSTHIDLVNHFLKAFEPGSAFYEIFEVVIQLGAILAVILTYWSRLWPWASPAGEKRGRSWGLWLRILVSAVPAAVIGFLIDDWRDAYLDGWWVRAAALIVYGVAFIVIERWRAGRLRAREVPEAEDIPVKTAGKIGLIQLLSLIPGTSRSGTTILGGSLLGVSRKAAAEFSFFAAIPIMAGASGLKVLKAAVKGGLSFAAGEWAALIIATLTAFAVSMLVVRALIGFLRSHSFECFGWYRIALGILVLLLAKGWIG